MENLLIISISVTALAVILQAGILIALYIKVIQASKRTETMMAEIHQRALPVLDSAGVILNDSQGKLSEITENLRAASSLLRAQMERVDHTMSDIVDRTRLQVMRADEMVTRTMDRVEETTEMVQQTVVSPVRQLTGLLNGVTAGFNTFFRRKGPQSQGDMQDEELFI